jgi:uncharacterized protein
MKRRSVAILILFTMAIGVPLAGQAADLGIITGKEKGTYYAFGQDLRTLAEKNELDLRVEPSNGSIENIYAVYKRPGIAMGIVQSDVLAFVSRVQSNPALKAVARKIKMVYPLYNEEIHVLGRNGLKDFDDLAGKRVAVGEEGSGTYLTARLLFEVSKIKPKETVMIGTDAALQQLKEGKIDAMFYVAGFPVKLFKENVTQADGLRLLSITNPRVLQFYPKAEIPSGTYSWQGDTVQIATVKAVLVCFDFRTVQCELIGKFAKLIADQLAWLQQNGHPKWKSVDLSYRLKGWDQYDCVARFKPQAEVSKPKPAENPVMDAVKQVLE